MVGSHLLLNLSNTIKEMADVPAMSLRERPQVRNRVQFNLGHSSSWRSIPHQPNTTSQAPHSHHHHHQLHHHQQQQQQQHRSAIPEQLKLKLNPQSQPLELELGKPLPPSPIQFQVSRQGQRRTPLASMNTYNAGQVQNAPEVRGKTAIPSQVIGGGGGAASTSAAVAVVQPKLQPVSTTDTDSESIRPSSEKQRQHGVISRNRDEPFASSLTTLLPKPKMKSTTLNRRNLSKVAYTYQAVIRPSSPSYMSSTSASRNRSSKQTGVLSTNAGVGKSNRVGQQIQIQMQSQQQQQQQQLHHQLHKGRHGLVGVGSSSNHSLTAATALITGSQSTKTINSKSRSRKVKGNKRSRFRLAISHHDINHSNTISVVMKEKFLMKILSNLSWNELLAIRWTCKKWYEIISTESPLKKEGVILLRRNLEGMSIFNKSLYVWTQFRIFVSVVFDFTDPMQQEFWSKHGKTMSYLEIRNSSMTLSALVEILSRCPNLEHFSVTWTAEMYSFNSEMIKKYYGIHFRNGTFVKLHELTIDKSYFLTDNALWSLLKWCGGSIHKLALTCGPEDHEDTLSRLKPRWSIEPIQNYTSRFGYSGNFKYLDFSGSNLNSEDLKTLAKTEKLSSLVGLRLSNCKINDEAVNLFVERKGTNLEEFYVDNTQVSEKAFEGSTKLGKLRSLNISGKKGNFRNLEFIPYLKSLEDFICSDTAWLTYTTLAKPLEGLGTTKVNNTMKKLDISSSNNIISRVDQRMSKIWFNHLTLIIPKLVHLNLNFCGTFGSDDNFNAICTNLPLMEKLQVRDWTSLTDEALVGMTFDDIIKQYDDVRGFWKNTDTPLKISPVICNLKYLKYLDLGGCKKLTDICIQFAIIHLPLLAKLGLDKTQVTDSTYHLLISKSSKLERLSLVGCEHIMPKANYFTRNNGRLIFIGKL